MTERKIKKRYYEFDGYEVEKPENYINSVLATNKNRYLDKITGKADRVLKFLWNKDNRPPLNYNDYFYVDINNITRKPSIYVRRNNDTNLECFDVSLLYKYFDDLEETIIYEKEETKSQKPLIKEVDPAKRDRENGINTFKKFGSKRALFSYLGQNAKKGNLSKEVTKVLKDIIYFHPGYDEVLFGNSDNIECFVIIENSSLPYFGMKIKNTTEIQSIPLEMINRNTKKVTIKDADGNGSFSIEKVFFSIKECNEKVNISKRKHHIKKTKKEVKLVEPSIDTYDSSALDEANFNVDYLVDFEDKKEINLSELNISENTLEDTNDRLELIKSLIDAGFSAKEIAELKRTNYI